MDNSEITKLFDRYKKGECTPEEIRLLHKWLSNGEFVEHELVEGMLLEDLQKVEETLPLLSKPKTISLKYIIAYAASLLIILGIGYYWLDKYNSNSNHLTGSDTVVLIEPGHNKALLKLDNGSVMVLDTIGKDELFKIDGSLIKLNSSGQLTYIEEETNVLRKRHQVITPNGGQYEIVLPDGTHVWLNSSSSISFTSTFRGLPERRVDLDGEAYFKVSKDSDHPFIVSSGGQEIKVLGTEFNVSAYSEDDFVKASLVEGSVLFNEERLKPGQSATYNNNKTTIDQDNIDDIIAWKNGYFVFFEESLEESMKKVGRWYDIEIFFADNDSRSIIFGGSISKYENAQEVFKMIEKAGGVKIDVRDRKAIITKI